MMGAIEAPFMLIVSRNLVPSHRAWIHTVTCRKSARKFSAYKYTIGNVMCVFVLMLERMRDDYTCALCGLKWLKVISIKTLSINRSRLFNLCAIKPDWQLLNIKGLTIATTNGPARKAGWAQTSVLSRYIFEVKMESVPLTCLSLSVWYLDQVNTT